MTGFQFAVALELVLSFVFPHQQLVLRPLAVHRSLVLCLIGALPAALRPSRTTQPSVVVCGLREQVTGKELTSPEQVQG